MYEQLAQRVPPEQIQSYLATITFRAVGGPEQFAEQVEQNGNQAFADIIPSHFIHVPAAVARQNEVEGTLEQIIAQRDTAPGSFAVIVSANYPASRMETSRKNIAGNVSLLTEATRSLSDVPLSYYLAPYDDNAPIGLIREQLLLTGALTYCNAVIRKRIPPADILLSGWDADTRRASTNYFAALQERYLLSDAVAFAAYPRYVLHDPIAGNFPRINGLIDWMNLCVLNEPPELAEQHFTTNLGGFALSDGFLSSTYAEHKTLWESAERNAGYDAEHVALPGVEVVMPSRRLITKILNGERIGYGPLTSTTELPATPTYDIDESHFIVGLYKLLNTSFDMIAEDLWQKWSRQGLASDDLYKRAQRRVGDIFLSHAHKIGATEETVDIIRSIIGESSASGPSA